MNNSNVLLVFDCFGVVIHTVSEEWYRSIPGYEEKLDELLDIFDTGDRGDIPFEETITRASKLFDYDPEETKRSWYESAKPLELCEFLPHLKEKYAIEMLSNASAEFLRDIFDKYDIEPLFDEVVISSDVRMIKPEKEIFEYAIKNMGKSYDKVFFMDDNPRNVEAAKKVGMIGILYKDLETFKKDISKYIEI